MPIPDWIQAMYAERIHPLVVEATKGSNGDGDNGNDSNDSGNDNSSNNEPLPYMNQLTVQRYPAGAGIPAHIDALDTIGPYVVGLSLGSGVTMDFERRRRKVESSTSACDENAVQKDKINTSPTVASPPPPPVKGRPSHIEILHHVPVHLTVGSLLVMAKDARYQWHHAIRERKTDVVGGKIVRRGVRVSLTFRAAVCATATGSLDVRR